MQWGDYSEQYIKALADVGIRVPLEVMKFTRVTIDEDTINKPDDLNELWELAQQKAKPKEEVLEQRRWENLLKSEFDHEIDTAVRQNVEPDYRYAMTRAFVKMGHEVEPKWFSTLQITQDLTKSKVLARQESMGKCLKSRKSILQTSHFERVALFAAESELRFSITYTTFISKYSWFLHMRRICEFGLMY